MARHKTGHGDDVLREGERLENHLLGRKNHNDGVGFLSPDPVDGEQNVRRSSSVPRPEHQARRSRHGKLGGQMDLVGSVCDDDGPLQRHGQSRPAQRLTQK
ncbi:MAG: hypothetical protein WAU32_01720 [Thermoanaerobaculia bacterium]